MHFNWWIRLEVWKFFSYIFSSANILAQLKHVCQNFPKINEQGSDTFNHSQSKYIIGSRVWTSHAQSIKCERDNVQAIVPMINSWDHHQARRGEKRTEHPRFPHSKTYLGMNSNQLNCYVHRYYGLFVMLSSPFTMILAGQDPRPVSRGVREVRNVLWNDSYVNRFALFD